MDIVPCRFPARTHLQGQGLDMCKGQSSRSSFVEAGRAVLFTVDVQRFVSIGNDKVCVSGCFRDLQSGFVFRCQWLTTNQLQHTSYRRLAFKQSNCQSSESLPDAVPWTSTKTMRLLVRAGAATTCKGGAARHSKQNNSSPAQNLPPPHPHTWSQRNYYGNGLRIIISWIFLLFKCIECMLILFDLVRPTFAMCFACLRPGRHVEDTVGHCFCEPLPITCRPLALAIARLKPGGEMLCASG